jgi:SPP1 gp7 family putative phage head morphogenesis protein
MDANSAAALASTSAGSRRIRLAVLGWLFSKGKIYSEHDKRLLEDYNRDLELWKLKRKHFPSRYKKYAGKRPRRPKVNPNSWSFDTNFREYVRREIAGRKGGKAILKAYDLSTEKGRAREWRRIKRKLKDKALRAIFRSKAGAVKKVFEVVKNVKNFDTVDFVKRKIRIALSMESRRTFEINDRLRLNVAVRTNLRKVHIAGKLHLLKPTPIKPVLRFYARRDERTCPICGPCHGTTLPKTHTWWRSHIPPLHHGCRCTIKALSPKEAAKWARKHEGVDKRDMTGPKVRAHRSFGSDPTDPKNEWRPRPKDFPPEMRDIVERELEKQKQKEKRR